jgi:hypothetical protein
MANGFNPDYWAKGQFMKNNPLYANTYNPNSFDTPQSGGFDPSYWNNVGGDQSGDLSYWNNPQMEEGEPDMSIWDKPGGEQSADLSVWNNPGGDQSADLSVWDNVGGDQSADLSVWDKPGGNQAPDMSVWDNVGGDQSADLSYWDNIGGDVGGTTVMPEQSNNQGFDPNYWDNIGTKTANKIAQDGLLERGIQTEDDIPGETYEDEGVTPYLEESLYDDMDDLGQTPATEEDLLLADERMEDEGGFSWGGLLGGLGKGFSSAGEQLLKSGGYQYGNFYS